MNLEEIKNNTQAAKNVYQESYERLDKKATDLKRFVGFGFGPGYENPNKEIYSGSISLVYFPFSGRIEGLELCKGRYKKTPERYHKELIAIPEEEFQKMEQLMEQAFLEAYQTSIAQ